MKLAKCDFVRLLMMRDGRSYCIGGIKRKVIIEECSKSEVADKTCSEAYEALCRHIDALRCTIRKGRQQGLSGRELDPYRKELSWALRTKFWLTHKKHEEAIVIWSVPVTRRTDIFELTRDAAERMLNEINTENHTNYSFY